MSGIPKIIHYCWFGRNPLPKLAIKCINSWKKFFPDYEIKEWNEDNFDVNIIPYTSEAYSLKKYAFVSDYARFWILYNYGGLYFDTDVEVINPMDGVLFRGFMGIEIVKHESSYIQVNPGLGLASEANNQIYKDVLNFYERYHFISEDNKINQKGIVPITTEILMNYGLKPVNEIQVLDDVTIYPIDFFNPYDYTRDKLTITENTLSIHWFGCSWVSKYEKIKLKIGVFFRKYIDKLKK